MKRTLTLLIALLLAPLATLHAGDSQAGAWKSVTNTITVDGRERTFLLDVQEGLKPGAALVMVFHGYTDSAEKIRKYAGFTPLAGKHGFVAVYPQGTPDRKGNSFFNVGYAFHRDMKVDDAKFAEELAAQLVRDLRLDPQSVFCTGMSNGGDLCYFLASRPQPFMRAIAPVAGFMMVSWSQEFVPHRRMSVMAVHGTRDKVTLWAGDPDNRDGWGAYLGTESVMSLWVKGLSLGKSKVTQPPTSEQSKQPIQLHHWWTAADDTEVRLYAVQGGGHKWPATLGNNDVSTAGEIWEFFQRHRQQRK